MAGGIPGRTLIRGRWIRNTHWDTSATTLAMPRGCGRGGEERKRPHTAHCDVVASVAVCCSACCCLLCFELFLCITRTLPEYPRVSTPRVQITEDVESTSGPSPSNRPANYHL